ncbi:hypothetical protein [Methanoregula sp.]|uniref:hypothetical protein n=1 Tax=Methanoregula sp. TaxID=2052170 RepID=UPI0026106530|nr:hypothetical protein [Methanoregula sp.]MDD5141894.1 hypothetical protein [Methanoregula sp.]
MDFTIEKYENLCSALSQFFEIFPVNRYLIEKPQKNFLILRHDIDRKICNALQMAKFEHTRGIQSTYYFRYPYTFKPDMIKKIQSLGHEIGYHYEVLSKSKGNFPEAIQLFENELTEFKKICDIQTICMHGSPLSKFNNLDLWKKYEYSRFGIIGEAFLSVKNIPYFSDTGRSWSGENNLRDHIDEKECIGICHSTDDLIKKIQQNSFSKLYLNIHSERWATSNRDWIYQQCFDECVNIGKKVIRRVRNVTHHK